MTEPPAASRIKLLSAGDMLTLAAPARGLASAWGAIFIMGVMFLGLGSIPFFIAHHKAPETFQWVMIGLFPAIGLILLPWSLHGAFRRTAMVVSAGELVITQTGLLGKSEKIWQKGDIQWIRVGLSRFEVNKRKLPQLHIIDKNEKTCRYLTGWPEPELSWITQQLREALGLNSPTA